MDEATFKPTNKEPVNDLSKGFEKNFKKTMTQHQVNLTEDEINGLLTEKEQSLKKKIFSLPKMESLVFADPKLSSVYDEMSEDGEERFGYHYNETIMNMLFNDYVLNSPKYLQKYKMAIPKEKKRRDKSGINKLKKVGVEKMEKSGLKDVSEDTQSEGDITKVVFLIHKDDPDVFAYFPEIPHSIKYMTAYSHVGQHSAIDPNYARECREANSNEYQELQAELESLGYNLEVLNGIQESSSAGSAGGAAGYVGYAGPAAWKRGGGDLMENGKAPLMRKPIQMITAMHENYLTESNRFEKIFLELNENYDLEQAKEEALRISKEEGVAQHVNKVSDDNYKVSDWYDADNTVISFEDGRQLNEVAKSKSQQRFFGMVDAVKKGKLNPNKVGEKVAKAAKDMSAEDVDDFASTKHKDLPEKFDEEIENSKYLDKKDNNIKEDMQTMANKSNQENPETMANKMDSNAMETGMATNEADQLFEEIENEFKAFSIHHDKLKKIVEDRKTTSMILGDRLRSENPKNFSKDLQHSGTKEIINIEKELEWKDQQTDVPKDPQKLGLDIEKNELKVTDAKGDETFKNVGNSANDNGDEIPKRNLTDEETDEVDLYRKGLGDLVYDNKPDERFEERMKADMGDKLYKQRQDKLEFTGKAPMYNKDPQPIEDTTAKKVQFDKEQTGWNERKGLKEAMVIGKFINVLGKTSFIDFDFKDVTGIKTINEDVHMKLNFDGLGNTYDSKVNLNEGVQSIFNRFNFYTNGTKVFAIKNPPKKLNENVKRGGSPVITEEYKKMQHLLGYKPNDFINTKNIEL